MSKKIDTDEIFDRLQELSRGNASLLPVQFQSRVTGGQYQRLYELISRYVPESSKILDWGCGNGHFSYFITQKGFSTKAYSFETEPLIAFLKENSPVPFEHRLVRESDPVMLPFESETFDVVTSVGVLEHVRETGGDEIASMKEIQRVLVKGGLFICYHFPNQHSYIEKLNSHIPSQHHHTYKYTGSDIKGFCDATGFELLETGRYGLIPRNSWNRLPHFIRYSRFVSKMVNHLDGLFGCLFARFCQNHYFVARKR